MNIKKINSLISTALIFSFSFTGFLPKAIAASTPTVSVSQNSGSTYTISVNFSSPVPSGNVIDVEVHDSSNNKVWQASSTNGGASYNATTSSLNNGTYKVDVGLFTANWGSNYAWYDGVSSINVSGQTQNSTKPTVSISQNSDSTFSINANFPQNVPSGEIVDAEVYDSSNNKVWQDYSTNGGTSFSWKTKSLPQGSYKLNMGVFGSGWSPTIAWYDGISSLNSNFSSVTPAPSTSPTPTPSTSQPVSQSSNSLVTAVLNPNSTYTLTVNLPSSVPAGDIIDLEVHDSANTKVWQSFTDKGGSSYTATTTPLPSGTYTVSLGLFTPNWASNYAWYNNIDTLNGSQGVVSSPTVTTSTGSGQPSQSPVSNQTAQNAAQSAYSSWKSTYVQSAGIGLRVVRPDNSNDTVSEGIGYGMLLSYFAGDQTTFDGLWNYGKNYLDSKGLMNWQINSSGSVIGQGSATDADEDMAYALLRAESKWPGHNYGQSAKNLINAMMTTEVVSGNYMNPGDNWGSTPIMNPSYLAPAYYRAFASFTGNSKWNDIANANLSWEQGISDSATGLVPDWLNADHSQPSISWDTYPNGFYYDAVRAPIRLLMDFKWNGSSQAQSILSKESSFISGIGINNLKSGYSLSGSPLTSYLDSTFMSAYAAMGQVNSSSQYASDSLNALIGKTGGGYFGDSLRAITLFIIGGAS